MQLLRTLALLAFLPVLVVSQIQIFNFTTAYTNLSSTCVSVLNQAVACDSSLQWAGRGRYEASGTLTALCTTGCTSALSTWLRRASGACTTRYVDSSGNAILPAYWVEGIVENYNLVCVQNSGQFCNVVVGEAAGINPENQKQTKSADLSVTCNDCFLKQIQTRLQMPLQSQPDLAKTFTSLTSACAKTGFSVTPIATTTQWITSTTGGSSGTTSTPTPGVCDGTTYTISSGDTCNSFSVSQGVGTVSLLAENGIPSCADFPTSGTLCIPRLGKCKTYTLVTGDTCAKIADANGVTWAQIVSFNPELGYQCSNIPALIGYQICVTTPGATWANPIPVTLSPTTTATTEPPFIGTELSLLPTPTWPGSINGSDNWVFKFAPETRLDCVEYANGTQFGESASCSEVAKGYGVDEASLVEWNPSLNTTCTLSGDLTYCIREFPRNATTFTEYCILDNTPAYKTSCADFLAAWGVELGDFAQWNPGVGSKCENWDNGANYCVMVKHFRQPGITSNCNGFAMANMTQVRDDPCGEIEWQYGLSHARFVAWNPSVYSNCTGMKYHYDYCVSIPNYKPTYSSRVSLVPTVTPNPVPAEANIQAAGTAEGITSASLVTTQAPGSQSSSSIAITTAAPSTAVSKRA